MVCDGTDEVTVVVWLTLVLWLALVVPDGVDEVEVPVWLTLELVLPALLTCVDPDDPVVVLWLMVLVCDGREVTVTEVE